MGGMEMELDLVAEGGWDGGMGGEVGRGGFEGLEGWERKCVDR